jgi:RNA polymerase sigma factor (sigma-70 family)
VVWRSLVQPEKKRCNLFAQLQYPLWIIESNHVDSITDNQLMSQVRRGQVENMGQLFDRHHVKLYNFFLRLTGDGTASEDMVQEVFFRMLKYRHSFRDGSPFAAWMYQIARHVQWDDLRRHVPETSRDQEGSEAWPDMISPEPTPDAQVSQQQEIELLRRALARLPLDKREVLVMSRFQELSCEQIAQVVRCDVGTVRVRIHRALRDLKAILGRLMGEKTI